MSSASVQWLFCRSSSTCRCISNVSVGSKVISASYSSPILPRPPSFNLHKSSVKAVEKVLSIIPFYR